MLGETVDWAIEIDHEIELGDLGVGAASRTKTTLADLNIFRSMGGEAVKVTHHAKYLVNPARWSSSYA